MSDTGYARTLGLFSTTMMVIGGIIGSGIFLFPSVVAARIRSPGLTLAVWGLGATVALLGAFIFAELGQRRPLVGGGYAYLREAFGPLTGFLYAWGLLLIVATGAAAVVAMTFAGYFVDLIGLGDGWQRPVAGSAVVLLTLLNLLGVKPAAWTQNVFTILKLGAILILVGAAFLVGNGPEAGAAVTQMEPIEGSIFLAVAAGLVPVLFAFGGWQQINFVAGEIIEPEKNLPRALIMGVGCVAIAYLLVNAAYLGALGVGGLANSTAPAADTMFGIAGEGGRKLISVGIIASTFGFLNLVILVSPRVYQAMAGDGLFFESFAKLHPTTKTPNTALSFQGIWALILIYSGTYGQLLDYVVFSDWIFFGLTAAALFVIRKNDGGKKTAFSVPLHPWSTALFILAAGYVCIGSVTSNPGNALRGAALLLLGVPVFLYWQRRSVA
jgi:APA family basic amino acid/polyamine antiporter